MTKANEDVVVNEGATYEAKREDTAGEKARVVAFFVDRPRSRVKFSPLGSSAEDSATIEEFLNDYTLIAQQGEALPEDKNQKAPKQRTEDREVRTPQLDTTRASPTREDLEARATARNER